MICNSTRTSGNCLIFAKLFFFKYIYIFLYECYRNQYSEVLLSLSSTSRKQIINCKLHPHFAHQMTKIEIFIDNQWHNLLSLQHSSPDALDVQGSHKYTRYEICLNLIELVLSLGNRTLQSAKKLPPF